jgi:hypothetical protein
VVGAARGGGGGGGGGGGAAAARRRRGGARAHGIIFSPGRLASIQSLSGLSHLFFLRMKSAFDMLIRKMAGFAVRRLSSLSTSISLLDHEPKRMSFFSSVSHA